MGDWYADLADLALGQRVVAVVTGLGGQIECDREPGLTLGEVLAIERVGIARVGMTGIGAEKPGLVACPGRAGRCLTHGRLAALRHCAAQHTPGTPQKVAILTHIAPRVAKRDVSRRGGAPARRSSRFITRQRALGLPDVRELPAVRLARARGSRLRAGALIRASV